VKIPDEFCEFDDSQPCKRVYVTRCSDQDSTSVEHPANTVSSPQQFQFPPVAMKLDQLLQVCFRKTRTSNGVAIGASLDNARSLIRWTQRGNFTTFCKTANPYFFESSLESVPTINPAILNCTPIRKIWTAGPDNTCTAAQMAHRGIPIGNFGMKREDGWMRSPFLRELNQSNFRNTQRTNCMKRLSP